MNKSDEQPSLPRPIGDQVRIGDVHLKVADLQRAIDFYHGVLGFDITQRWGRSAAFLSGGGCHHGVGEALYLHDPDHNGVELYWDKPQADWPKGPDGGLEMYTRALDLTGLLSEPAEQRRHFGA